MYGIEPYSYESTHWVCVRAKERRLYRWRRFKRERAHRRRWMRAYLEVAVATAYNARNPAIKITDFYPGLTIRGGKVSHVWFTP